MRVENVKRDVESSGTMQVAKATIKATPKIFDMFANDTYANKPLAIMRELVANGIDAHVAAGRADRPVEVVLPTQFDPTCRVRDFGTGMHHDFVMGPFMAYTDGSTKDKNDDAIGGFGIGSKSPFSYVDQYTLRVVHDGILSLYTMFKDEDGIPAIGLQAQTTTSEPNGVEVSFPVEDADMATFAEAAQEALQYFRPLPLVENGTVNPPSYTYIGNNWSMRSSAGPLGVIMGGVRYPVSTSSLSYELRVDSRVSPLLEYGLDLILPIGSCGVAMSREQLSYVPKTSVSIKGALELVIDDVIATFANLFDTAPTEWDAMKMLAQETGLDSYSRSGRAQLLMSNAQYKGKKLETSFRIEPKDFPGDGYKAWLIEPQNRRRGVNVPSAKWGTLAELYGITPGRIETVIIDDLPQSPKSKTMGRIKEYVASQPQAKQTIVLRGPDENRTKDFLRLLRNPSDYVLTSSLPEPVSQAVARVKSVRPRVRMFTYNGGNDAYTHRQIQNLTPARSKEGSVKEVPYADQPATGILVVMDNFDLPADLHHKMNAGLVRWEELSFVNATDGPKLKDTFKKFDDVFAERLNAILKTDPTLPQKLALRANTVMGDISNDCIHIHRHKTNRPTPAALKRPYGQLYMLWAEYLNGLTDSQRKLSPFVPATLPPGVDPDKLWAQFKDKQKDLRILSEELNLSKIDHCDLFIRSM